MTNKPTVCEQTLIQEQGEDFRTRIKQAIKKIEPFTNILKLALRKMIKEMLQNFIEVDDSLINSFYYKYFIQYEDLHFRYTMQCLNYIFDTDSQFKFEEELNYKYIAIIYFEQLRSYFQNSTDKLVHKIWSKLNQLKQEKEENEKEEGFWDDFDSENYSQQSKRNKKTKDEKQENENEFCFTKKEMQIKEAFITNLQTRLQQREQNLVKVTAGYLKELQTLREQLFRREKVLTNVEETFEVSYMDFTEILDPNLKQLFQAHILDLKLQFNNRTIDYVKYIQSQRQEITNLKIQIQKLNQKLNEIDGPSDLLKKLFNIDNNPYRIWKYIADIKGNFYFKEVFEKQKPVYSINYKEVNQLLMTNKAYEREFQTYKEQILQEQLVFFEKIQKEVESIQIQQIQIQNQKEQLENQLFQIKQEFLQEAIKIYNDKLIQEMEIQNEQNKQLYESINQQTSILDKIKIKYAFRFWISLVKVHKQTNISELLKNVDLFNDKHISDNIIIKSLEKQLQFEKQTNSELIAKLSLINTQIQILSKDYNIINNENKLLNTKFENIQIQLKETETLLFLTKSFATKIARLIDPSLSSLKVSDINLDNKNQEIVKSIMKSISDLNEKSLRSINEIKQQGIINVETYNVFIRKLKQDKEIQTDIILKKESRQKSRNTQQSEDSNQGRKQNKIQNYQQEQQQSLKDSDNQKNEKKKQLQSEIINCQHEIQEQFITPPSKLLNKLDISSNDNKDQQQIDIQFNQYQNTITPEYKSFNQNNKSSYQQQNINQSKPTKQLLEISDEIQEQNQLKTVQIQKNNNNKQKQFNNNSFHNQMNETIKFNKNFAQTQQPLINKQLQNNNDFKQDEKNYNKTINNKQFRLRALSDKQDNKQNIFDKLYDDSKEKNNRIQQLKDNIELLEKNHWNEILDIFNNQPSGNYILTELAPPKTKEIQYYNLDSLSYRMQNNKKYYENTKSKTPNKTRRESWIMKQTNCIEKMFQTLTQLNAQQQIQIDIHQDQALKQQTLMPNHLFHIESKLKF